MTERAITQEEFQESALRRRFGIGFDPWLFVLVAALIAFGLVMLMPLLGALLRLVVVMLARAFFRGR